MATSKEGPEMVNQQNETFIEYPDLWKCSMFGHSVFRLMTVVMILMCVNPCMMSSPCCVLSDEIDHQRCNHVNHNNIIVVEPVARYSYPRTRREVGEEDARFPPRFPVASIDKMSCSL